MRRTYCVLLSFTLISIAVVPMTNSAQPPVATNTLEVGTIGWGPVWKKEVKLISELLQKRQEAVESDRNFAAHHDKTETETWKRGHD